jgi:hypothetical protein
MSLFAETFSLLVLAGLVGIALGWLLHGRCDDTSYDKQERGV